MSFFFTIPKKIYLSDPVHSLKLKFREERNSKREQMRNRGVSHCCPNCSKSREKEVHASRLLRRASISEKVDEKTEEERLNNWHLLREMLVCRLSAV